ncbi:hypothetical protein, partial [Acinetobacter sp. YH18001]|uniref:hypothetical protein n=1 Tax=Acinetobacter sp. YH18001 TaxID=2601197 RepID=UPI001C551774
GGEYDKSILIQSIKSYFIFMCLENKKTTGDWYILKSGSKYIKMKSAKNKANYEIKPTLEKFHF